MMAAASAALCSGSMVASLRFMRVLTCRETIVTVLYPGARAPRVAWDGRGKLTVNGDRIEFRRAGAGWLLKKVNGEDASRVGDGTQRTLTLFRRGK